MIDFTKPIPELPFPLNKNVPKINTEPLVRLSDCAQLVMNPVYFKQGIPGAVADLYLRREVYERLLQAASLLPAGYRLMVFDAWRPYAVQKGLYDTYYALLQHENPACTHEELAEKTKAFVSPPSLDVMRPAVHSTGGAVDVSIVNEKNELLAMGTDFDDFSPLANTNAFELAGDIYVRNNRRLLYNCMLAAGFTNLPTEWWHYDYGDGFWAYYHHTDPFYNGITE